MTEEKNAARPFWRKLPFIGPKKPLVTVLELSGVIGASGPGRRGLTHARLEAPIEAAFKPASLAAVALAINSPGGSPVQSTLIHDSIRRHAKKKNVPVYAFIEDVGASGGYMLALAGDEIYADASSIVGSIGVIAASFGFQEAIARLGVERRVYTSGESKSQLDPFRAEDPKDIERLRVILGDIHEKFIAMVKARRGDRLKPDAETFSGAFWTADPALERGLIDGKAHLADFMKARFGEDVKLKKVAPDKGSLLRRLTGGETLGGNAVDAPTMTGLNPAAVVGVLEEQALWARYGL